MDFAAIIIVADEGAPQLEACLKSLRYHYPFLSIRVISDGVNDPEYRSVCAKHAADYELGRYLKRIECGGDWWKRVFSTGLSYGTEWIIKLDPDTIVWRPLKTLPKYPVSGSLDGRGMPTENIQGGFQAIHRNVARQILNSNILDRDDLRHMRVFCPNHNYLRTWIPTGYFTTDHSLMHIMRKMGIAWGDWPEIRCTWSTPPDNKDLRYAVTHPHKIRNPYKGLPENTKIHLITTCKGRLAHLKNTLPRMLDDKLVEVTVVDYDCPDNTYQWLKENQPSVRVVKVTNQPRFHLARARNLGAKYTPEGWWMFVDADLMLKPGWAKVFREKMKPGYYHIARPLEWSMTGTCILESKFYRLATGYDENISGWAPEDIDFYAMLRQVGCRPRFFPGEYASPIKHLDDERTQFYDKKKRTSQILFDEYFRLKTRWMYQNDKIPTQNERLMILKEARKLTNNPEESIDYRGRTLEAISDSYPSPHQKEEFFPPIFPLEELKTFSVPEIAEPSEPPFPEPPPPPTIEIEIPPHPPTVGKLEPVPTILPLPVGVPPTQEISPPFMGQMPHIPSPYQPTILQIPEVIIAMGNISVVNHSSIDLGLTDQELVRICNKFLLELDQHWPGTRANCIATKVILPNTRAVIIMDSADHNEMLGYQHLTPDGMPCAKVMMAGHMTEGAHPTISVTHQLAEMQCDPYINIFAQSLDGTFYSQDVCDPVADQSFSLGRWLVANFVTPAWFQPEHKPGAVRMDYAGNLDRPFVLSSAGYALTWTKGAGWNNKYGSIPIKELIQVRDERLRRSALRKELNRAPERIAHSQYLTRKLN